MRHPWLFLLIAACAHADVTLRYSIESSVAAVLPPGVEAAPTIRMKGARGATTVGRLKALIDVAKREVTVVDEERKTFATFPAAEYADRLAAATGAAAAPPSAGALAKPEFKTRKTGRVMKHLDIEAEETEAVMNLKLDEVAVAVTMRIWTPRPAEVLRIPALREATAASLWLEHFLKTREEFEIPEVDGIPLHIEIEVRMSGAALPGVDPAQPMFSTKIEAVELSTAALDDALFRVPEGFAAKPPEDVLKHQNVAVTAVSVDASAPVQAFVPNLDPVEARHLDYSDLKASGSVRMLVAIAPDGRVLHADPIAGPEPLRQRAVEEVMAYRYRPVLRDGKPVAAMTAETVFAGHGVTMPNMAEEMQASERVLALERQFPRTPEQVLADLENDCGEERRTFHAVDLAKAALDAGALPKAERYARLALAETPDANDEWNRGNRVHYGHIVLGRIALRRDDAARAAAELVAAGKTPGSPQLNSFGPDLLLARELLQKGERAAVLQYLDECRAFWALGGSRLDQWTSEIRAGKTPNF